MALRIDLGEEVLQTVRRVKAFLQVGDPRRQKNEPHHDTQAREPAKLCGFCLHELFSPIDVARDMSNVHANTACPAPLLAEIVRAASAWVAS